MRLIKSNILTDINFHWPVEDLPSCIHSKIFIGTLIRVEEIVVSRVRAPIWLVSKR